ncbi:hypothetical protein BGZ54_004252 [Gamsiella multidivaricata]|nr:hypothetical protein BGZ54_004252 [Gamsiella multidivaricata]
MTSGSGYLYSFQNAGWTEIFSSISLSKKPGLAAATNPDTNMVYIPNGFVDSLGSPSMLTVDLNMNTMAFIPMPAGMTSLIDYSALWSTALKSMVLFGGKTAGNTTANLYTYSPITNEWATPATKGTIPSARSNACFVPAYNGSKLMLFGGLNPLGTSVLGDIYILDVATLTWAKGTDMTTVGARSSAACGVSSDYFLSWGGSTLNQAVFANTTLIYNMRTNQWTNNFGTLPTTTTSKPTGTSTSTSTLTVTSSSSAIPTPTPGDASPRWPVILGTIIALIIAIVAVVVAIRYRDRFRRSKNPTDDLNESGPHDSKDTAKDYDKDTAKDTVKDIAEKEEQRYSHLRGPTTEEDPFGILQRNFSGLRGPSTAGLGAKDDRAAFSKNGSRRYSHLRGPSTAGVESQHQDQPDRSSGRRAPNEGDGQVGFQRGQSRRVSRLRAPAIGVIGTYVEEDIEEGEEEDEDDWAAHYAMDLGDDDGDYIPPPPPTLPSQSSRSSRSALSPRRRNPQYPMPPLPPPPPSVPENELSSSYRNIRGRTRRAPATYERESVFGYVDGTPTRGSPQEVDWETK